MSQDYRWEREAHTENKALIAAFNRGREDYINGKSKDANPYPDVRTSRGGVTYARAFRNHWERGWTFEFDKKAHARTVTSVEQMRAGK